AWIGDEGVCHWRSAPPPSVQFCNKCWCSVGYAGWRALVGGANTGPPEAILASCTHPDVRSGGPRPDGGSSSEYNRNVGPHARERSPTSRNPDACTAVVAQPRGQGAAAHPPRRRRTDAGRELCVRAEASGLPC